MTRLEILNQILDSNSDKLDRYENVTKYLSIRSKRAKVNVIESTFTPLFEEDTVEFNSDAIYIYFGKRERWADMKIYLNEKYSESGSEYKTEYEISTSSNNFMGYTTKDSEWIVTRFEKFAAYAKLIVDFMEEAIPALNTINDKYSPIFQELYDARKPYREAYRKAQKLISDFKERALLSSLNGEGVTFNMPEDYNGYSSPNIDLKFNWNVRGIKSIKVLRTTPSGKSADVEITTNYYGSKDYDGNPVKPLVVERVRLENVLSMLNQYRGWINE